MNVQRTECPYLDGRWDTLRAARGMSDGEVIDVWQQRRERAQAAGYWPKPNRNRARRISAWLSSGVDNPFQTEDAFLLRLGMALRELRGRKPRKEEAA